MSTHTLSDIIFIFKSFIIFKVHFRDMIKPKYKGNLSLILLVLYVPLSSVKIDSISSFSFVSTFFITFLELTQW